MKEEEKDESEVAENEEALEQNGKYDDFDFWNLELIFTTSFHQGDENSSQD